MENGQLTARNILLKKLGGDKDRLEKYLQVLDTCHKPYEVASKVIGPMFVENDGIDEQVVCKKEFYGSIASLATPQDGKPLKPANLYYHITTHLPQWKKEKRQVRQQVESTTVDVRLEIHDGGIFDTYIHIHCKKLPEELMAMLKPYIYSGYAKLETKVIKGFDARTQISGFELSAPLLLMPDFLMMLKEFGNDTKISYTSSYTYQQNLSVDEALEIATIEADEDEE